MKFTIAAVGVIAAASCASAFVVPTTPVGGLTQTARSTVTRVNAGGKYDGKLWDDAAKNDVKSLYNADEPRSETNFDPFAKDDTGNKCDASGWYPGESRYKDPIRPNVSFAEYLKQKAEKEAAEGSA